MFYIFAALSREWICWAITKTFLQKSNLIDLKHISEKRKNQYIIVTNLLPPFSVKNKVKTGTIKALKQCENSTIPSDKHKRKRKRKLDNQQILTSLRARQAKVQKTFKNLHEIGNSDKNKDLISTYVARTRDSTWARHQHFDM